MANFWTKLPKPFLVLSPMEDVTDVVFREIVAGLPRPDVFFTEFVNADGLFSKGRDITIQKLKYTEAQRPIVAQIWGTNPDNLYKAAALVEELGFDGVDINMGCPVAAVTKKGAGAALVNNHKLAGEIIQAVKNRAKNLPISVKTRLGFDKVAPSWIHFLLEQQLDALTIHGRTALQMSKGDANWEEIGKAVELKNKISSDTIIIGNGDIKNYQMAKKMYDTYHVDGVMLARGIFNNPWAFDHTSQGLRGGKKINIRLLIKHIKLFEETWGETKNFEVMKKFFKMYIKGFNGANELRQSLMECHSSTEVFTILEPML